MPSKNNPSIENKELELPETIFVRDIENRVFQAIVVQSLDKIEGVGLLGGNILDSFLGRERVEGIKGIHAEQDSKSSSVNVKLEVNIHYGIPIPEKAHEIQTKVAEEITKMTGLHVACIHVVFKNVLLPNTQKETSEKNTSSSLEDYSEEI